MSRARVAAFIAVSALGAFGTPRPGLPVPSKQSSGRPLLKTPVDVAQSARDIADVMERTHYSFDRRASTFVGGDDTYAVEVAGRAIHVRPDQGSDAITGPANSLTLTTSSVSRGTQSLINGAGVRYERTTDGSLSAVLNNVITESLENTRTGLEQRWAFDSKPDGDGDLDIVISATGQEYVTETANGLHFRDSATETGILYSHGTWVDAQGRTTAVVARYEAGQIHLRIPSTTLDASSYPAVLDPTISAETAVDSPLLSTAPDTQKAPDIGHPGIPVGGEFTVVWQDRRRSTDMTYDIYAATVDRTGHVVTPVAFPVTDNSEPGDQISPRIVDSVVVYASNGNTDGQYKIMARPVTGGPAHQISAPALLHDSLSPVIARIHPNDALQLRDVVAWRDVDRTTGNGRIYAAMFDHNFNLIGSAQPASSSAANADSPAIASQMQDGIAAPQVLLVWSDNSQFAGVTNIEEAGIIYTNGTFNVGSQNHVTTLGSGASHPTVVDFQGGTAPYDGFLVGYDALNRTTGNVDVQLRYLYPSGVLGGATTLAIAGGQTYPALGGHNTTFDQVLLAWNDDRKGPGIHASRIGLSGSPPTPTAVDLSNPYGISSHASGSVVISSDSNYFVAWGDTAADSDIYGANYEFGAASGTQATPYRITSGARRETHPAGAWCNGAYLLVWRGFNGGSDKLFGSLLSSAGTVSVAGFSIGGSSVQGTPAVTCDRKNGEFFVAWEETAGTVIYGTGVTTTGTVLAPGGAALLPSGATGSYPALADDGSGHLWLTYNASSDVAALQIDITGTRTLGPVAITTNQSGTNADIAFDAATGKFFVVWEAPAGTKNNDIFGAPLTNAGVVEAVVHIEQDFNDQRYPRVRFDPSGGVATVVYEDDRNLMSGYGVDIVGHRTTTTNPTGTAFYVAHTTANEYTPTLSNRQASLDEVTYWLAPQGNYFDYDVWGESLNGATPVAGYAISSGVGIREMAPSLACSSATSCVVGYASINPADTTTGVDRIQTRVLGY